MGSTATLADEAAELTVASSKLGVPEVYREEPNSYVGPEAPGDFSWSGVLAAGVSAWSAEGTRPAPSEPGLLVRGTESSSAGHLEPDAKPAAASLWPPVTQISPEAQSYLRDPNVKHVVDVALAKASNQARVMGAPVERVALSIKHSREERWVELLLQVFVPLNIPQSTALWEAIGDAMDSWMRWAPKRQADFATQRFAIFVEPLAR